MILNRQDTVQDADLIHMGNMIKMEEYKMDLANLLKTTPESLAKLQYDELKKFVIDRLDEIKLCLENDLPEEMHHHTFGVYSSDNGNTYRCINFDYGSGNGCTDIVEIALKLIELKKCFVK